MAVAEEHVVHICDLDEVVLCHITALLRDPVPLSLTCKSLLHASRNSLCKQLWFQKWHNDRTVSQRHVTWAVLSWRALASSPVEQLLRFLGQTMQGTSGAKPVFQQQLQLPLDCVRNGEWLQWLRLVAPYADHLLLSAAAASQPALLQCLLQDWQPPVFSSTNCTKAEATANATSSSSSSCSQQSTASISTVTSTVRPSSSSYSSNTDTDELDNHMQQHEELQQDEAVSSDAQSSCKHMVSLPASVSLHYKHNILQSAVITAATAGQHQCLELLLQQLSVITPNCKPCKLDLLVSAAESAAAAGSMECLHSLWPELTTAIAEWWHLSHQQQAIPQGPPQQQHLHEKRPSNHAVSPRSLLRAALHGSRFLVVAAASSGSTAVLSEVLQCGQFYEPLLKLQLPAALIAAGRRGHVDVLRQLLALAVMSSRPLQLAAADAATHSWPSSTLTALLQHMAQRYRIELLQLLAKPLQLALQCSNTAAAEAMLSVLQAEACMEQPEVLKEALLLLANQGCADDVSWVLKVAPTVLVKLGQTAVAAALEGGYPHVAQLILDAGAERPAAYKAAAKRGELVSAVRKRDVAGVRALLTEISLPLMWTCETTDFSSGSGSAAAAAGAGAAAASSSATQCVLSLLKSAADAGAPSSVQLLQLLLQALPAQHSAEKQEVLVQIAKHCLNVGACAELDTVLSSAGRSARSQARLLSDLLPVIQLPDDVLHLHRASAAPACSPAANRSVGNDAATADVVPGVVAAALLVLSKSGCSDILSRYVANPYLATAHPVEYLGTAVRPCLPAVFMPCLKGLLQLFRELSRLDALPPGAKVKDVALYKLMVRTVLQSCDRDLIGVFLEFIDKHGEAMLSDVPQFEFDDVEQDEEDDW